MYVHSFLSVGKQPVAWKEYCVEYWLKDLQESKDRCTGLCDVTEVLFKTALNIIQSIHSFSDKMILTLRNKILSFKYPDQESFIKTLRETKCW